MSFYENDGARVQHHLETLEAIETLKQQRLAAAQRARFERLAEVCAVVHADERALVSTG